MMSKRASKLVAVNPLTTCLLAPVRVTMRLPALARRALSSTAAARDAAPREHHGIALSERAVQQIKALRVRENNPLLKLRVSVDGGGCSGFQYSFALADAVQSDDTVVASNDAELLVDALSLPFLKGAVIDYERELVRAAFKVAHNPNAEASCGCGSSFVAKS